MEPKTLIQGTVKIRFSSSVDIEPFTAEVIKQIIDNQIEKLNKELQEILVFDETREISCFTHGLQIIYIENE